MKLTEEMSGAVPIWLAHGGEDDEYGDFLPDYTLKKGAEYRLRIAADSDYAVYAGDELIGFGQYSDYPTRAVYDDINFVPGDDCVLRITAWHCGVNSQPHIRHKPYVLFCLYESGSPVCRSSPSVPSRPSCLYVQHRCALITSQMGPGFALDGRKKPEKCDLSEETGIGNAVCVPRPNFRLEFGSRLCGRVLRCGRYDTSDSGADAAMYMKNADLSPDGNGKGSFYLFDFGMEAVGFPDITIFCDRAADVYAGWGEHITDGMCRTAIGSRRFTFTYAARAGENHIFPVLRRIGCRYMQLFIEGNPSDVSVTLSTVVYPAKVRDTGFTGIRRRIYDTAVNTLRCSMHEHYEDCPWREQALYTLDSRNQMLAGYTVFENGNREMARASLDLISRGVRPDGLLTLCYPAGIDYPIPFYTLAYFVQMKEYLDFSGDIPFITVKIPVLEGLMDTVVSRMTVGGRFGSLVPRWDDRERKYWNFYEWSPGMDGHARLGEGVYDAPFNACLVTALECLAAMLRAVGRDAAAEKYAKIASDVRSAVARVFARGDGFFASFRGEEYDISPDADTRVSVLTQALVLLSGAADGCDKTRMLEAVAANGGSGSVPATLSMACFRYDALLRESRERYAPVVLAETDRDGAYMLSHGATSFWETIKGESDFGGAGSLCHGWSAMAAYYYNILL